MKSNICLIRHGLTEGNLRRLYYGASDIPLSGKGEEELRKLAAEGIYPAAEEADFYTTGMIRTEQTLKLIYGEQEHQVLPLLKEINFGEFEMKSYEEMKDDPVYQEWISDKSGTLPPPGRGKHTAVHIPHQRGLRRPEEAPCAEDPFHEAQRDGSVVCGCLPRRTCISGAGNTVPGRKGQLLQVDT